MFFKHSLSVMLRDTFCSDPAGACLLTQTCLLSGFLSLFLLVVRKICFCLSSLKRDTKVSQEHGHHRSQPCFHGCWVQSLGAPGSRSVREFSRHEQGTHHPKPASCPPATMGVPPPTQLLGFPCASPAPAQLCRAMN